MYGVEAVQVDLTAVALFITFTIKLDFRLVATVVKDFITAHTMFPNHKLGISSSLPTRIKAEYPMSASI